jgi:hypothetical protein
MKKAYDAVKDNDVVIDGEKVSIKDAYLKDMKQ